MTKRCDQPICIEYEECEPNKYGEIRKKILGVKNRFTEKKIITKLKNWVIKSAKSALGSTALNSETTEQTRRIGPLGLVSITVTVQKLNIKLIY